MPACASWARRIGLLAGLSAFLAAPGAAVDIETLVMPGPVIEGHADVESECTRCHRPFDRSAEDALCIECHEEVGKDLRAAAGFHGKAKGLAATPCRSCHTDHEGREADVVGLNEAVFDHLSTDYPLHGAHRAVSCSGCHEAGAKHREASSACVDCHRAEDTHRGGLGEDCAACHDEEGWKRARFDHGKTKFPLEGAHEEVACRLCHADEKFKDTLSDCATCHVQADVHRGLFGPKCGDCHGVVTWDRLGFDHDRDTNFRLTGKHASASCRACHPKDLYGDPAPRDCVGCHREDDVHRGRSGRECQDCHDTRVWSRIRFDHAKQTRFVLHGAHEGVECTSCHMEPAPKSLTLPEDCAACHGGEDPHRGGFGRDCARCHTDESWKKVRLRR